MITGTHETKQYSYSDMECPIIYEADIINKNDNCGLKNNLER